MTKPTREAIARAIQKRMGEGNEWLMADDVMEALTALEPELEAMREALAWYADRKNYVDGPSISKTVYAPYYSILDDEGQRARAALNKETNNE